MTDREEDIRRAFLDRRGRPSTNIRKLARDHRELALERLVQLMFSGNDCAALGAVRSVLERSDGRVAAGTPAHMKKKLDEGIRLTIKQFTEAEDDGSIRHHGLPVVYGGWQGPRDLGVPVGPRLRKVRRERARADRESQVSDGTQADLPGTGAPAGDGGGMSAAAAKRSPRKTPKGPQEE